MASSLVGRASAANSAGASSMAAAFRETKNDVVACSFTTCSPTPGVVSQHKHYHPVNLGTREPMFDVSLWSLRKVEEHQALAKAAASAVSVPEERRLGKRKGRGKGKGQGKAKAPKTKSNEISEEATGGGKGKGKGKQKVPRAAAEAGSQFPKKSPRIGPEFQAVLRPLPPLGPRPGSREDKCRKAWGTLAATTSEEDKSLDLFTAQLLNEFRADISEDEILETLRAMERLGTGYPWFTSVRANLAQKVAVKAEATAAAAAVAAANAAKVPSLRAKAVIAGAVSISKSAVATAACEEACTAFSSGGGAFSAGVRSSAGAGGTSGAASSSAVPSAEVSAVASSGASSSSEAADASAA